MCRRPGPTFRIVPATAVGSAAIRSASSGVWGSSLMSGPIGLPPEKPLISWQPKQPYWRTSSNPLKSLGAVVPNSGLIPSSTTL